jgi:hypothetical protein
LNGEVVAELFNKRRRDFQNLTYFHASNEAKLEIRKTILTMYVNSRPYWYQRLEQKTGKFDLRTKLFIYYLLERRIRNMWERHELRLLIKPKFHKAAGGGCDRKKRGETAQVV